jgi:hypothetical protein
MPCGHNDFATPVDTCVQRICACAKHSQCNHDHQHKCAGHPVAACAKKPTHGSMMAPAIAVNGVYSPMASSNPIHPQVAVTHKAHGPCQKDEPWKTSTPASDSLMSSKAAPG